MWSKFVQSTDYIFDISHSHELYFSQYCSSLVIEIKLYATALKVQFQSKQPNIKAFNGYIKFHATLLKNQIGLFNMSIWFFNKVAWNLISSSSCINVYYSPPQNQLAKYSALTHWGRDKMDALSQTTFSSAFSWMKIFRFRLKFLWTLFLRVQLTIFHHWFR